MTTMLRYVRYLRKLNGVGWKVTLNQQTDITGGKFILENNQNLIRSYATVTASKSIIAINGSNIKFLNFEEQIKRSGKVNKADINILFDEIQSLGTVSSLDGLLLIRSCGKALIEADSDESIQLVQEIWNTLENLNTPIDVSHFNTLLNVYIEKNHDFSPVDFLKMMKDKSIEPNRVTYQRLIRSYCSKGDIAGATKILEVMKDKGMPLCEYVFNSLILGYSESNNMENAVNTLNVMKTAGIPPSADTYTELMCAYAKRGDLESILNTLQSISQQDIILLHSHYLETLCSLAVNGHEDKAETFLKELPSDILSDAEISRCLFKLILSNHVDLALKVLLATTKDLARQKIRIKSFIRALLKSDVPIEKTAKMCRFFEVEFQSQAFTVALDNIFNSNLKLEKALVLLKSWAESGAEIRNHYFWPMLVHEARAGNKTDVKNILKTMIDDFKVIPSIETLKNYVIPYMFGTWEYLIEFLMPINIPKDIIYNAIADRLLIERKLKKCATFVSTHLTSYSKDVLLQHLVETLNSRDDFQSFVVILRFLSEDSEQPNVDKTPVSLVDAALREALNIIPDYKTKTIIQLLNELVNSGLSISPEVAAEITNYLGDTLTDEVKETIEKLASGTLTVVPMDAYNQYLPETTNINFLMNPKKITELRQAFAYYLEQQNENKVLEIIQMLMSAGYISVPVYAQAISLFSETENLVAAESCVNYLKEKGIDIKLDFKKIVKYTELLVKNNRFSDAITFIAEQRDGEVSEKLSRSLINSVRALLETTANTKNVEYLHQLFNLLKSKNFLHVDNYSLGPLIKIHLLRNDFDKALDAFEKACTNYRCTPYKNLLAKAFIEAEDASALQRMTDLCTGIHGESNALVDLALCFLEYGQSKQAQKIFETPGLQLFNEKISSAIEHFSKFNKIEALDSFVKITKSIQRMDRAFMYENLIDFHYRNNNWTAGLALWTDMQEDDVQPTSHFLQTLYVLLEKNNQQIPFAHNSESMRLKNIVIHKREEDKFNLVVKEKNYDYADELLETENWSRKKCIHKYNYYITTLLEHGELDKALNVAETLMNKYATINRRSFTELAHHLIEAKRFNDARELGRLLDQDTKNNINFWKLTSNIDLHEKGLKYFIENFKMYIPNNNLDRELEKNIHFGSIVHCLLIDPSYINEYEKWAQEMWDNGIVRAMQALWNYYFINYHAKEAEFYDKFVQSHSSPLVRPIIEVAKQRKDPILLEKFLERLDAHPHLSINIKARTYVALIEIYTALNRFDEGLKILNEISKHFRIDIIPKRVLLEIQNKYEQNGEKFPYIVTIKRRRQGNEENQDDSQSESDLEKVRM